MHGLPGQGREMGGPVQPQIPVTRSWSGSGLLSRRRKYSIPAFNRTPAVGQASRLSLTLNDRLEALFFKRGW